MKKNIVNSILVVMLCLFAVAVNAQQTAPNAAPQQAPDSNHEVLIQVLVASNEAGRGDLPANLEPLAKKLRADLGFTNYRLALTQLNRVAPKAFMQAKGISPFGQNQTDARLLNFYEIDLGFGGIKPSQAGESVIQIANLSFVIRIPLIVRTVVAEGKEQPVVNYENLTLKAHSIGVSFNEPTVIGTLTTSRPNESLVLVVTVKPDAAANRQTARND